MSVKSIFKPANHHVNKACVGGMCSRQSATLQSQLRALKYQIKCWVLFSCQIHGCVWLSCQHQFVSVGAKLSKGWMFQTQSLSKLANSIASVMCYSMRTYNVCLDLSCLLCINLCHATGRKVTERQMRTSSAVWRMVAVVPPGHSDGTTSIQPLRSLKCTAFWLCQHCSAQQRSNSPDHCQKPWRKSPENRRGKCWSV